MGASDYERLSQQIDATFQKPKEKVCQFIPRIKELLLLLEPTMSDREQMRQIRQKLRPEYKQWIAFAEPTGVAELQSCCMKVETGMLDKRVDTDEQEGNRKRSDKRDGRFNSKPKNQGQGQGRSKQGHQPNS